ncbi:general odorant-binding protein 19d [Anthonomus grandis grandis]|uniref:general odorant-binding protein 19d n=1 Tax=Anthonomus grandis grandis TaxID=2921223 RepID=UPI00216565F6|nr:general odorant-binding protein 19d [Anthonomus grandis grandis]
MNSLFVLVVSVFASAYALSDALREEMMLDVQEYGIECAESEKATPEDIEALMNRKPPVTHNGKCVIFCVSKKLNLMNDDGSVVEKPSTSWLDKAKADDPDLFEKMAAIHELCKEQVKADDPCDAGLEFVACGKQEAVKAGLGDLMGA